MLLPYSDLVKGAVRSCGCLAKEIFKNNGKIIGENVRDNFCIDGTNIKNLTMKIRKDNISGIKGVCWDKTKNKWKAQIRFKGKNYLLGRFDKKEDAAEARRIAEEKIFGNFLEWYAQEYPDR